MAYSGDPITLHAYRASTKSTFTPEAKTFFAPEATPEFGDHVYRAQLDFKNPLIVDSGIEAAKHLGDGALAQKYESLLSGWDSEKDEPLKMDDKTWEKADKQLTALAKEAGYDGIVFHGHDDLNPVQYMVVDPKAITSHEKVGKYNWSTLKVEPDEAPAAETKPAGETGGLERVIDKLNKKDWFHGAPENPEEAYAHRGKFMASSYRDAEFYGKPDLDPHKLSIKNPLIGGEQEIAKKLGIPPQKDGMTYEEMKAHDRKWALEAKKQGYDAIVMASQPEVDKFMDGGRMPRHMEVQDLTKLNEDLPEEKTHEPIGIHHDDLPYRAKYADVDFDKPDLQDTGKRVTAETIRKDYVRPRDRKKVSVYQSYIPMEDLPTPKFVDEEEENFDRQDYRPRSGSPIKVSIHPNGSVNILDGNHRVQVWGEQDQQYAPAWVIDHRSPNIEQLSEEEKAEREEPED